VRPLRSAHVNSPAQQAQACGDTVAAINHAGVAFLERMEGKILPGVEALKVRT
jgi:3-phosphoglycerate kinase